MSPRHQIASAGLPCTSASTASKAWRLPWMSETMATCMDLRGRPGRWAFCTNVERPRRVAVAVVAAFVVAEAAVLLLRPRDGVIAPVPVDPGSYFTPAPPEPLRAAPGPPPPPPPAPPPPPLPPRPARALRRRHGDRGRPARVARAP